MAKRKSAEAQNGATADPPKRRGRPRKTEQQPMLNDDPAFERIKEIEDLANAYVEARDQRQQMLLDECDLKGKLIEVMKKYDRDTYNFDGYMVALNHVDEDQVKVKKLRAAKDDGSLA